jgi:Txe/YoeB family toxin of Txe-Axe toxin-antitoxin module
LGIHLIISAQRCQTHDLTEWRQSHHHLRSIKKNYRLIQTLKHSTSKDEAKREAKQDEIKEAYQVYIDQAQRMVHRAHATCQ